MFLAENATPAPRRGIRALVKSEAAEQKPPEKSPLPAHYNDLLAAEPPEAAIADDDLLSAEPAATTSNAKRLNAAAIPADELLIGNDDRLTAAKEITAAETSCAAVGRCERRNR